MIFQCKEEPAQKKQKSESSGPSALCVAVNGDYVAVGYHGDGIKLFSLETSKKTKKKQNKKKNRHLIESLQDPYSQKLIVFS